MSSIDPYAGPVLVTILYTALYYGAMINVLRVKSRLLREHRERGEDFDRYFGQDRALLAADRIQLNMLEHMPPFLVLLWLNAVFVSSAYATVVGGIYAASRCLYPFLLGRRLGGRLGTPVYLSTGLGYLALIALCAGLFRQLAA